MLTLDKLREKTNEAEWEAGEKLVARNLVERLYRQTDKAEYIVRTMPYHSVVLHCTDGILTDGRRAINRYTIAALLTAEQDGVLRAMVERFQRVASTSMMDAVNGALPRAETLRLEVTLRLDADGSYLSMRIGETKLYVIRDIQRFLQAIEETQRLTFGKGFTYEPQWMGFSVWQEDFLSFLKAYLVQAAPGTQALKEMKLSPAVLKLLLTKLRNQSFLIKVNDVTLPQEGIEEISLPASFQVAGSEKGMIIHASMAEHYTLLTPDGEYLLMGERIVSVRREDRALTKTIAVYIKGKHAVFTFAAEDVPRVMGEVLPTLMRTSLVTFHPKLKNRMHSHPLKPQVYLDRDGADILARVLFVYGQYEIDPFTLKEEAPLLLLRDAAGEKAVMDELAAAGFRVRRGFAFMSEEEHIYGFITKGVHTLGEKAEVFFSNEFKRLSVRTPRLSAALKTTGNRLSIEMYDDGTPIEVLIPILQAIRKKKRYFRLPSGTFLLLEDLESWEELADAVCEAESRGATQADLGLYRAAYFNTLIKERQLPVTTDAQTLQSAALRTGDVVSPIKQLHAYQQRGFEWIYSLYRLNIGGILADEMGLGKTVQTLAAILCAAESAEERKASVIITPTSLLYNWQSEVEKFTPSLSVLVISGKRSEREKQIELLQGDNAPDLVIASYPIARQDIDLLEGVSFRFAVLDEAQNIKNPMSQTAYAVKRLKTEVRLALSGTPMENNVSELWSLFDFILPGYMPALGEFMRRYEDGKNAENLSRRIRPFLMRRLKKDVMAELPSKLETVLYAGMTEEQRRMYSAVLLQKRESIAGILSEYGLRGQGEVLAAMTELRQICCHPRLVLDNYTAESGKMELLLDILPGALQNGHRALIFSQFTGMLKLILRHLEASGIRCMYLDGETPARERLALAERFNAGEGSVFLVSLKAGGTGLNLTGADMVIHYDPWWNPMAEEQAIDRAHRLGQEKEVHVIRLVTRHSIEEKVLLLSSRKKKNFDNLITPGAVMPERLTKQDILSLFED